MSVRSQTPTGYLRVVDRGADVLVRPSAADWVSQALRAHGSLQGAAKETPQGEALSGGRAQVCSIPAPDGEGRWVVRHYQRGGVFGPALNDRYLRTSRPRAHVELQSSLRLRAADIRTPLVIAAAHYPRGLVSRADLITQWVPGLTLERYLRETEEQGAIQRALEGVARTIIQMADLKAHHVDLNANNLMVDPNSLDAPWVLDLDRMRFDTDPATAGRAMAARLIRSMSKLEVDADALSMAREVLS